MPTIHPRYECILLSIQCICGAILRHMTIAQVGPKKVEAEIAQERSSKRAGEELEQEISKKQKVEEDKESEELKQYLEIIPDDGDDVTIDATPLSSKSPTITMFEHHVEDSVWKNQQGLVKVLNWKLYDSVAGSSSVRRPESKDSNLKKRVLPNNKCKSTSKDVKKSQSSFTSVSNKNDTMNSNVSKVKANVLKAKTINVVNDGSNLVCVSCGKYVFLIARDKCVTRYALSPNSTVKRALFTSPVAMKSSKLGATHVVLKSRFSVATTPKATNKVAKLSTPLSEFVSCDASDPDCPLDVDNGCSKHMTGNLKLLRNFIEKLMGTIRFGNDNFAAITEYGDYVQGNLIICHVYYVEGLRHNLFSVGQICDEDLEVAFRSNTCYVWNLEVKVYLQVHMIPISTPFPFLKLWLHLQFT
ncbi:hypothetical protein Tco_0016275 [Tanacetum coccineum]